MLAGAAAFVDLYATQPLLPLFARTFRASAFQAGLTITAPTIAVAISAPFIGRLADRVGLKRVIVGSAFLLAVATGLAAMSRTLWEVIGWRFVQGVMTPGIFAGTVAYIHEEWPVGRAGRGTAAYMTGTIMGGFSGRAIAGFVAADATWRLSFVALAGLTLALATGLLVWLPVERSFPRARPSAKAPSHGVHDVAHLFRNQQLLATFAIGFCVLFTQVAMFTYVTFHLAGPPFWLSTAALGWLFVVYVVGVVVTPFSGAWIDRYGQRTGLATAMGLGAAGGMLTLIPSLAAVAAGLALSSTGVFIAQASTSSYIGAVTTRDRALAVGLYSTFYYIGGSVGGALPAALWTAGGWPACVALIVTVQLTGVAIAMLCWRDARARPVEPVVDGAVG
jgi:MFS transporter, YNFM family, putative membrane transport protein